MLVRSDRRRLLILGLNLASPVCDAGKGPGDVRGSGGRVGFSQLGGMYEAHEDRALIDDDPGESYVEKRDVECRAKEQIT